LVEKKWNFIELLVTNCQRRLAVKYQFCDSQGEVVMQTFFPETEILKISVILAFSLGIW